MASVAPFSNDRLRRFMVEVLRPRLSGDFEFYHGKRDVLRLHGNFVQLLAVTGGRYGETLKVLPTFYVVGARPWDEVIPQSVALDTLDRHHWRFQDVALDELLADEICKRLASQSPLSFTNSISDEDVATALQFFIRRDESESAALFLAYFFMASGLKEALPYLTLARKVFSKLNKPFVQQWQLDTMQRFNELESRLSLPDRMTLCRREADQHATRLKLPKLSWSRKGTDTDGRCVDKGPADA